jgi:hypothetical protein
MFKGGIWVMEQPHNSVMHQHCRFQQLVHRVVVFKIGTYLGSFGGETQKHTALWSNHRRVEMLQRRLTADDKARLKEHHVETCRRYVDGNGKRRCVGIPGALKSTQPLP